MGDLGGEEAEGGELLVFAEGFFALENAGVEAGVLEGDGAEGGEGGEKAFLVVVEAVYVIGEYGEDADDLVFVENGRGEQGAQRRVAREIDDVDELGRLDVEVFDLAARVDCGRHQAGGDGEVRVGQGDYRGVGERDKPQRLPWGVVEVEGAGAGVGDDAGVARDRVEQLLLFEFADEGLADGDERFELAGFATEVAQLPEALHDGGGLFADAQEEREVGVVEAVEAVAVEVDDPEDLSAGLDHGGGHFAADFFADGNVAGVGGDVGDELGASVEGYPASDALAEAQADVVGGAEEALVDVDLEFAGVGVEERDGAGGRVECLDRDREDRLQGLVWIVDATGETADAIKRAIGARIGCGFHGLPGTIAGGARRANSDRGAQGNRGRGAFVGSELARDSRDERSRASSLPTTDGAAQTAAASASAGVMMSDKASRRPCRRVLSSAVSGEAFSM